MKSRRSVHFFVPCLVRDVCPDIARASLAVLGALGVSAQVPSGQTCCGQMLYKQGHAELAAPVALRFLELFESSPVVVAPSASCVAMVRAYPELFPPESPDRLRAECLAAKTYEFTEYIVNVLGASDIGAKLSAPLHGVYHASCQAERTLSIVRPPRALLENLQGLTLSEAPQPSCCGFGGGFSLAYPEVSHAILEEKIFSFLETGATTVIGVEPSCLTHMTTYFRKHNVALEVLHIAQILAKGLEARS